MDELTITMRCAANGGRFRVILDRASPNHRFRIREIRSGTSVSVGVSVDTVTPASSPRWQAEDLDWSGWHCGCCDTPGRFAYCPGCRELVCGANIRRIGERDSFACYAQCGYSGLIEGTIQEYDATPSSVQALNASAAPVIEGGPRTPLPPGH